MGPMTFATIALLVAQAAAVDASAPTGDGRSAAALSAPAAEDTLPAPATPAAAGASDAAPPATSPTEPARRPAGSESQPAAGGDNSLGRSEAPESAAAEPTPEPAASSTAGAFIQNRFNPDLSVITDFTAAATNVSDETAASLAVPGFIDASEREGKLRGINFHYLELALSCAVDLYFDFFGVVSFAPTEVGVEEAYVDTRQLPFGFRLRLGKLLSAFGRLNGQHQHYWDFYDQPLVYEAFMGLEGWKNPGVRLSWTAPFDYLLELDLEVFKGESDESPTFNAAGYDLVAQNGTSLSGKKPFVPALYVGSLKTSFDVGDSVFLLGASVMVGHATQTRSEGLPTDQAASASGTVLYDGELTYKYLISSYRSITWQSEYLGLVSSGDLALAADGLIHKADQKRGGFYSQLIWRFDEPGRWRVGARFDLLDQNSYSIDGTRQPLDNLLPRYTTMLEYSPTEFSRFRLQYAYDRSRFLDGARQDLHEVLLQMNIAVGPHGAHAF
jgi:hypothetical protein